MFLEPTCQLGIADFGPLQLGLDEALSTIRPLSFLARDRNLILSLLTVSFHIWKNLR